MQARVLSYIGLELTNNGKNDKLVLISCSYPTVVSVTCTYMLAK